MTDRAGREGLEPLARALITAILRAEVPGLEELREQARSVIPTGGSPTHLELAVAASAPRSPLRDGPIPVRTLVETDSGEAEGELILWVSDGRLASLEYAWYTDNPPSTLPPVRNIRIVDG